MDWKQVIKRNREALAVVIAGLIAMTGQADTIPHPPSWFEIWEYDA